jgi:hypothetical protein
VRACHHGDIVAMIHELDRLTPVLPRRMWMFSWRTLVVSPDILRRPR